jgi:hypothetical protein
MNWKTTPEKIEIKGTILRETGAAILISHNSPEGTTESIWFPLSTVHSIHRSKIEGEDTLVVSLWIATKKGLV